MSFVIVIVIGLFSLSGWVLFVTFRRLSTGHAGLAWWLALGNLAVAGAVIGYWLAFDFEYDLSPNLRLVSFPIPVCIFHFEDGKWVDFPSPNWLAYPTAFTNVVAVTAFVVLPLLLASRFQKDCGERP